MPDASSLMTMQQIRHIYNLQKANVTADYDSTATYEIGDYCLYLGILYRCISTISTAEDFDSSHWVSTNVDAELDRIETTSKTEFVAKTDIVNNLTSTTTDKPLSAAMGKFLSDHYGKTLWEGSAFTSGSINVPDLNKYKVFEFFFSDTLSFLVTRAGSSSIMWGGINYLMYGSNAILAASCRYSLSYASNTITIDSNNRGYSDGTNSNYSGKTDGLIRIAGIV